MDGRIPLQTGFELTLGDTIYSIKSLLGFGSNAFVYSAVYRDNLQTEKTHTVLIKELFPYHQGNLITRDNDGRIEYPKDAADLYERHKTSFLRGNGLHLDFADKRADMASVNINSYEANGTVYSVIGNSNGETLQAAVNRGEITHSLAGVVTCLLRTLDALEVFHENGLLHLDLSPDNILLMPPERGRPGRRAMLIDYNSVWSINEMPGCDDVSFSIKENYSAPEVRLQDKSAVSYSSDLFSVCAIFWEYLRGEPMNFAEMYSGGKITGEDAPLLRDVPASVASKALAIVKKGLRFSPGRRYQSVMELRVDLIELLNGLGRVKRKRYIIAAAAGVVLAAALFFGVWRVIDINTAQYPRTAQEVFAAQDAMTALSDSMTRLGHLIRYDIVYLETGRPPAFDSSLLRTADYSDDAVRDMLGNRSPIPRAILAELLNAPEEYAEWSANMVESLGRNHSEEDRAEITGLVTQYISHYSNLCYIKLQLAISPLSSEGKRPILNALPYMPVFSDRFLAQPFITDKAELESMLEAENIKLGDIIVRLKSYGF